MHYNQYHYSVKLKVFFVALCDIAITQSFAENSQSFTKKIRLKLDDLY